MNNSVDFPSFNKTCQGKCIIEMQKILEPSVIVEFFEVIRDFHNDDQTAKKLKNIILSETSDAVKLLNERASEMILMVDEMFLNRRQRQSSFYRLCHKLARKNLPEGSYLPDESKCVCFSKENLRKFNVDAGAVTSLDFSSNLVSIKEALKQYFGELRCTECGRFMQLCRSGSTISSVSDCSCSSPSITSQHKVHEAILELSKAKDDKVCLDRWYLTQLKRDADYYMNKYRRSSISSDESINSFEVISCTNQVNFQENEAMDNESFGGGSSIREEMLNDRNKFSNPIQDTNSPTVYSVADIQDLSKNLNNKLMHTFSFTANLTDANKGNTDSLFEFIEECKDKNVKMPEKRLNPAAILRKSFSPYFDKSKNAHLLCNSNKSDDKATVCPAENLRQNLLNLHIDSKLVGLKLANEAVNFSQNEKESKPSDSLKCALSSYFKKEAASNWLRN